MPLLSLIIFFSAILYGKTQAHPIHQLFHKHVNQVSSQKVPKIYTANFKKIMLDEQEIFKICQKAPCQVKVKSEKMSHRRNYHKVRLTVLVLQKGQEKPLQQRQGCYFVENLKIDNYIEDCEGH